MRIVKLFKENLTLLTSVIVAFALGMGFAYALSAYFLAWEYSPEAVEALSALGVFLTPIVALWIFTRWRQQQHSQEIMNQVSATMSSVLECQYAYGQYANKVLTAVENSVVFGIDSPDLKSIKRIAEDELYAYIFKFKESVIKLKALEELIGKPPEKGSLNLKSIDVKPVIKLVDEHEKSIKPNANFKFSKVVDDLVELHTKQFKVIREYLVEKYRKG